MDYRERRVPAFGFGGQQCMVLSEDGLCVADFDAFTIEVIFQLHAPGRDATIIAIPLADDPALSVVRLGFRGDRCVPVFELLAEGERTALVLTAQEVPVGSLLHLTATYNSSIARLYVNGLESARENANLRLASSRARTVFGARRDAPVVGGFIGVVVELRLFGCARTREQVEEWTFKRFEEPLPDTVPWAVYGADGPQSVTDWTRTTQAQRAVLPQYLSNQSTAPSVMPARIAPQFASATIARRFQFFVDGVLGLPKQGVRIGRGATAPDHRAITSMGTIGADGQYTCSHDAVPLVLAARAIDGDLAQSWDDIPTPLRPIPYTRGGISEDWNTIGGLLREHLEHFDGNLCFDIVAIELELKSERPNLATVMMLDEAGCRAGLEVDHNSVRQVLGDVVAANWTTVPLPWCYRNGECEASLVLAVQAEQWRSYPMLTEEASCPGARSYAAAYLAVLFMDLSLGTRVAFDQSIAKSTRVRAATGFLSAALADGCDAPRTLSPFDEIERIAQCTYESRPPRGLIAFCGSRELEDADWSARLRTPVRLSETRRVRKLLETAINGACLLSDSNVVLGIGRPLSTRPRVVQFIGVARWRFKSGDQTLLSVDWGWPSIPRAIVDRGSFARHLTTHLHPVAPEHVDRLYELCLSAAGQEHGTLVLISDEAPSEASRLAKEGMPVHPCEVDPRAMSHLSTIDGAILLDKQGRCHAIGVILDGSSLEGMALDSSRGARFNSAVRYVLGKRASGVGCSAVVISEDGSVDLI